MTAGEHDTQAADLNLFMMCPELQQDGCRDLPVGYQVRSCRRCELDLWKAMPFDDPREWQQSRGFMDGFFDRVYAPNAELFFERCLFVCDQRDQPVGTAFLWKTCGVTTLHWLKVQPEHEGRGIGRALISMILRTLPADEFPVLLHTHPQCARAVKLYSDLGFRLLSDPVVGTRVNHLSQGLLLLKQWMPPADFERLSVTTALPSCLTLLQQPGGDDF